MSKHFVLAAALLLSAASLPAQSVTVTSPNGGESWALNSSRSITWSFANAGSTKVTIVLRSGNGVVGTIKSNVLLSAGSWQWTSVGRLEDGTVAAPGSDYAVRIRDAGNTFGDNSDGRFSIAAAQPPGITVLSPNYGSEEMHVGGQRWPIEWSAANIGQNLRIVLVTPDNADVGVIAENVAPNSSPWSWLIGQTQAGPVPAGGSYKVRVATMDGSVQDASDAPFLLRDGPKPAIIQAPIHDRVPPPVSLFGRPKLAVTAISLARNASGYGIVFGYKNVGDGPLPRRHELAVKPDYRVLIDDREVDRGDLFIPESPAAGPGWEMASHSGGFINFPVNEPRPWNIGDRITILLNERNALNMGTASKTSSLRLIALTAGYDLAFSGPAVVDWNANRARVTITKVGALPQNSTHIDLTAVIGYYHTNTVSGGANEATVTYPNGAYTMQVSRRLPISGPFPAQVEFILEPSPYYELGFQFTTDARDQFDERNDSLPRLRLERPGTPAGPRVAAMTFSTRRDADGKVQLRTTITLANGTGAGCSGLRLLLKRNGSKAEEWPGISLPAGQKRLFIHYGSTKGPSPYNRTIAFAALLYDSGGRLIDSRSENHLGD